MGYYPGGVALTAMRSVIERSFDRTITRRRITEVPDGFGGTTTTTVTASYSGRVVARQVVTDERLQGGRVTAETVYLVRLPWNADVAPADVLVVDGTELQVTDADDIKSLPLQVIVNCYRVT